MLSPKLIKTRPALGDRQSERAHIRDLCCLGEPQCRRIVVATQRVLKDFRSRRIQPDLVPLPGVLSLLANLDGRPVVKGAARSNQGREASFLSGQLFSFARDAVGKAQAPLVLRRRVASPGLDRAGSGHSQAKQIIGAA